MALLSPGTTRLHSISPDLRGESAGGVVFSPADTHTMMFPVVNRGVDRAPRRDGARGEVKTD